MAKSFKHLMPGKRRAGKNGGILSNSGAGQRSKGVPKPSEGKRAETTVLDYAVGRTHTQSARDAKLMRYAK